MVEGHQVQVCLVVGVPALELAFLVLTVLVDLHSKVRYNPSLALSCLT